MSFLNNLDLAYKRKSWIKYPIHFVQEFLTSEGKVLIFCLLFSGPISFLAINTTAYMFLTMLTSLFFVSIFLSFIYKPTIKVYRNLPSLVETDSVIKYNVELTNIGNKINYSIKVREFFWTIYQKYVDENVIDIISPKEKLYYEIQIKFKKRGVYYSDGLIVSSSFPFGLFNWGIKINQPAKISVFPKYKTIDNIDINLVKKFQPGGIALSSNIADSTEFVSTREYVFGDNPRHIHWKSWAKTGKPIIKEFQDEFFVRLAMIIDTESTNTDYFEKSLSISASIADYLSKSDYIIDIFAAGNNIYQFQSGRALAHFENILELLACLEISNKINFEELYNSIEEHFIKLSAIILIFNDWDDRRENLVNKILENQIGVKIFLFSKKLTKQFPEGLKEYLIQEI